MAPDTKKLLLAGGLLVGGVGIVYWLTRKKASRTIAFVPGADSTVPVSLAVGDMLTITWPRNAGGVEIGSKLWDWGMGEWTGSHTGPGSWTGQIVRAGTDRVLVQEVNGTRMTLALTAR
jgi:hypothetical protein